MKRAMRLSRSSDYALRAMITLAGRKEMASGSELAKATGVAEPFLLKVLRQLVRARFVRARRGLGGGFQLMLPADQISMLRVVEAIDGPSAMDVCLVEDQRCDRQAWCSVYAALAQLQSRAVELLRTTSIDQLRRDGEARRELVAVQQLSNHIPNDIGAVQ